MPVEIQPPLTGPVLLTRVHVTAQLRIGSDVDTSLRFRYHSALLENACRGGVAQLAEQRTHKPRVGGSTPPTATIPRLACAADSLSSFRNSCRRRNTSSGLVVPEFT